MFFSTHPAAPEDVLAIEDKAIQHSMNYQRNTLGRGREM
jgi:hypothetical protein